LPLCEHNKDYDGENNRNVSDALDFEDKESDTSSDSDTDNGVNGHKNRASPLQTESHSRNQRVQVDFFENGKRKSFFGRSSGIKGNRCVFEFDDGEVINDIRLDEMRFDAYKVTTYLPKSASEALKDPE
jgi:hypothetical protein